MTLGGLGDDVGVGIASPVSVSVDHELRRRGGSVVEGATEVAHDPLESSEMMLPHGVHMQAHLLDGVGDVGPREGQVLEHAGQVPVERHVDDWGLVGLTKHIFLAQPCFHVSKNIHIHTMLHHRL